MSAVTTDTTRNRYRFIVQYGAAALLVPAVLMLLAELFAWQFMPEGYNSYLNDFGDDEVRSFVGPYQPQSRSVTYAKAVTIAKPADTVRIVSLGASGTEGWLSAESLFVQYDVEWHPNIRSSYSQAAEFILNSAQTADSKKIEVVNLGVAGFNSSDVIRMMLDAMKLQPDLLVFHIGVNEGWTGQRMNWPAYLDLDIPYFYSELAYEVFTERKAGWITQDAGEAGFTTKPTSNGLIRPIVPEAGGRASGIVERAETYHDNLERLYRIIDRYNIPALILVPTVNLRDFHPFGSLSRPGLSAEQVETLNTMLIAANEKTGDEAMAAYEEVLAIDDGIAEADFQYGRLLYAAGEHDAAREYLWRSVDRDLINKRPGTVFLEMTRQFVAEKGIPSIDVTELFQSKTPGGAPPGNDWMFDDVHPLRRGQFALGTEIARQIIDRGLLQQAGYSGDLNRFPDINDYDVATGYDDTGRAALEFVRASHDYSFFGRFKRRLVWDKNRNLFLDPLVEQLDFASEHINTDNLNYLRIIVSLLANNDAMAADSMARLSCGTSPERSTAVATELLRRYNNEVGYALLDVSQKLRALMEQEGCRK